MFTGEEKVGNKAQRGKTQPRSPGRTGDRALPAAARRAAEAAKPQCRAWNTQPAGASRPRFPTQSSPLRSPAQEARGSPALRALPADPTDAAEHPPAPGKERLP